MKEKLPEENRALKKEKLHTAQLEELYGPIKANVLCHNKLMREVHLEDKDGVSRTYALTFFPKEKTYSLEFQGIDKEIQVGGSIGKTFEKYGYSIQKNNLGFFIVKLPMWLQDKFKTKALFAKARVYEFYASKAGSVPKLYGIVVEIYPPEFQLPVILESEVSEDNNKQLLDLEGAVNKYISKK